MILGMIEYWPLYLAMASTHIALIGGESVYTHYRHSQSRAFCTREFLRADFCASLSNLLIIVEAIEANIFCQSA